MERVAFAVKEEALQGSLNDFPLPALLRTLAGAGRTGVLQIEGGDEIWLADGRVCLATSPTAAPVTAVLCGAGAGSVKYIQSLIDVQGPDSPSLLASILHDEPQLARRVSRTLYEHNLNAVFELLIPSVAGFHFQPGAVHPLGDELSHETDALVTRAEQRLDIWRQIAKHVPSTQASFRLTQALPDGDDQREVSATDWRLLALLDGRRTVADLVTETGDTAFLVCSTLYRMLLDNLIEQVPGR